MIDERIEIIIKKWLKCELIGDEAMTQIDGILHGNEGNKNEINDACTKEKHKLGIDNETLTFKQI